MVIKKRNTIWESENRDLRIESLINNFVDDLKNISKTNRDSYILKKLREILEEKDILE